MKKKFAFWMEWIRPIGIAGIYFIVGYSQAEGPAAFHIIGPGIVILMSGTVALEALLLGAEGSAKIGYQPDRAYQIQSGLNHLALAVTAWLVLVFDGGRYADATVVVAMLLTFNFSAANHVVTAIRHHNLKPVNLMRPIMTLLLDGLLLPPLIRTLGT